MYIHTNSCLHNSSLFQPNYQNNVVHFRQNLLTSFVRRLSRMNDALNPQDIKESDGEEDEPSDKWINVNVPIKHSNNVR